MSGRAFINSIKEGVLGIIRHPLVTMASITTIMMMLIIMGAFYMFSVNARRIMTNLSQRPPIEVYMTLQCTEEERQFVAEHLASNPNIIEYTMASPLENYEEFKANLGSSSSILDDFDYNMYLPYTFSIRLEDPSLADTVCAEVATYSGVSKVAQESSVMNFLTRASRIVNITTAVSFVVLFVIGTYLRLLQSKRDRDHEIRRCHEQLHKVSLHNGRRHRRFVQRPCFMGNSHTCLQPGLRSSHEIYRSRQLLCSCNNEIHHVA